MDLKEISLAYFWQSSKIHTGNLDRFVTGTLKMGRRPVCILPFKLQ